MNTISLPAAIVFGASAVIGGVSVGIAALDHVRATGRGEKMGKVGLSGPKDYLILAGAIFATALSVPRAIEEWSGAIEEFVG